ncbi:MAG: hypothetical protein J6A28_01795 [Clostridia bacterium]|nr:hypothetical protein [Clostridia bacterium]
MKKSHILLLVLSSALLLSGCATQESQAKDILSSQLDRIERSVGDTNMAEVSEVSPYSEFDANATPYTIQYFKAAAYQNMQKEEALRQDILKLNACLKACTEKPYNLTKSSASAVKELSANIKKYAECLIETKESLKENVKKIKKYLKTADNVNLTAAESGYITLNNNMNERYAYMSNIYSNLEQIYHLLGCNECCDDCTEPNETFTPEQLQAQNTLDETQATRQDRPNANSSNIDTFERKESNADLPQQPHSHNNYIPPAYNSPYFYNYNNGPFNPGRNTDSFYPRGRNIDTYRFNPNNPYNNYYGYTAPNGVPYQPLA